MKRSFLCTILLFTLMSLCVQANEVDQLKKKVDPYLTHVAQQSDWLYSRLQMYWKTHATDVFCNGETYDHVGGKRAPEPTVKMNGTRSTKSDYNRPRIEDIVPYDDDDEGSVTFVNATTGKMEKTSPNKTGCNIAALNNQILSIARDLCPCISSQTTAAMPTWLCPWCAFFSVVSITEMSLPTSIMAICRHSMA